MGGSTRAVIDVSPGFSFSPQVPGSTLAGIDVSPGFPIVTYLNSERSVSGGWSHPDVPLLVFGTSSLPSPQATFQGGPIATAMPVQLLFWGSWWSTAEGAGRAVLIEDRTQKLLASDYFSELAQYGIQPPHWRGSLIVTQPGPKMAFNSNDDQKAVDEMIEDLIDDDVFPDSDDERIAFVVLMPKGFTQAINANGAHTSDNDWDFPWLDKDWYWFAWVRSFGDDGVEDPEDVMRTMSHELVELFTDPETDGWYSGSASTGEIGDLAAEPGSGIKQTAWVNGVHVQAYWSNRHNANVIPIDRDYRARIVGTVTVDKRTVTEGNFHPDASDSRLCESIPACCLEDRDYRYFTVQQDETARLRVETQRYRQPAVAWTVEGQAVSANGPITVTVLAGKFTGREEHSESVAITLQAQLSGNDLILKSVGQNASFDVVVGCSVTDGSITGTITTNVIANPQLALGFVGVEVQLDPDYMKQRVACEKAVVKMLRDSAKTMPRSGPRPPGPVAIDPNVLAGLPVYTRQEQYQRARRAVRIARLATEMLDPERARLLTAALIRDVPALENAMLKRGRVEGKQAS